VDRLNQAIVEILAMPEVRDTILKQGIEVVSSTPAELGRFVNDELARWTPIIKAAGITAN
jgi:tripartite-type tricarboxylate transporter receptor subunit TctC